MPTVTRRSRTQAAAAQRIADLEALMAQMTETLTESAKLLGWAAFDVLGQDDKVRAKELRDNCADLCGVGKFLLGQRLPDEGAAR